MSKEQNTADNDKALHIAYVRQRIIDYTNWLMKQNLMILAMSSPNINN